MENSQLEKIAEMLAGLKKYEWLKIAHAIDEKFSSMENKLELPNKEEIAETLKFNW